MNVYYDPARKANITEETLENDLLTIEGALAAVRRSIEFWSVMAEIDLYKAATKIAEYQQDQDMLLTMREHFHRILNSGPIGKVGVQP